MKNKNERQKKVFFTLKETETKIATTEVATLS